MSIATPAAWARHLSSLVGALPAPLPTPGTALGAGEIDAPLLAAATGRLLDVPPRWRLDDAPRGDAANATLDVRLWWRVHQPQAPLSAILDPDARGPLLPAQAPLPIEVWTECELCALHALGRIVAGVGAGDAAPTPLPTSPWGARLDSARAWHLEHTQPDNATGRPWAVAVFAADPAPESQLYAQTLLHNALVAGPGGAESTSARQSTLGPLAAVIVADAARVLGAMARTHGG